MSTTKAAEKKDNKKLTEKEKEKEELKKIILSRKILPEQNKVTWNDVVGLHVAKEVLRESVILPLKQPQLFSGSREPWKGILLYGPPGTGKTFVAQAVAAESGATFFSISAGDLLSKWVGESEIIVKTMFEVIREEVKPNKPVIVFVDEIDSVLTSRGGEGESESGRRIKTEFLAQMDGAGNNNDGILMLGATNTPWDLDQAAMRRFQRRVLVDLPDTEGKFQKLKKIYDVPCDVTEEQLQEIAECFTFLFSGSDIDSLIKEVNMNPVRKLDTACQFYIDDIGKFNACENFPNCPFCPYNLLDNPVVYGSKCPFCQAIFIKLIDLPNNSLVEPKITIDDFISAIKNIKPASSELSIAQFNKYNKTNGSYNKEDTLQSIREEEITLGELIPKRPKCDDGSSSSSSSSGSIFGRLFNFT